MTEPEPEECDECGTPQEWDPNAEVWIAACDCYDDEETVR